MLQAVMTSTGQIALPREVREDLGLTPGSRVLFVKPSDGAQWLLAPTKFLSALAGILHRPGQTPLTLEELDRGIAEGAADGVVPG